MVAGGREGPKKGVAEEGLPGKDRRREWQRKGCRSHGRCQPLRPSPQQTSPPPKPDLVAPGLPRTASEQSLGSLVHGGDGGPAPPGSRTADAGLVGLPRNFSLSDLAFDNTGG